MKADMITITISEEDTKSVLRRADLTFMAGLFSPKVPTDNSSVYKGKVGFSTVISCKMVNNIVWKGLL
ncbi:unnamed protein product [Lathyrus oleraceus]